jgi:hypothetical protein
VPLPGSVDTLTLTVDPSDATTAATVAATGPPPTSTVLTPTAVTADLGHTWTAHPTWTETGRWVAAWTITGVGAGIVEQEVWVSHPLSPTAGVAWRPDLWKVADSVPGRTLVGAVDGYGNALGTFTAATHPTDQQVQRLITDGCAWVTLKVGPVHVSLYDQAAAAAALWVAARVELTWPDNRDDLATADQLYKQAVAMRDDLWRANEAATGEDPEDPEANLMPVYSFPAPEPWGDFDL